MRTATLTLVLLFAACGGCDGNSSNNKNNANNANNQNNTSNNENNNRDGGSDGPIIVDSPFGLDARPANPDCVAKPRPPSTTSITLNRAFPNLTFNQLVWLTQAPGDDTSWYAVEKFGVITKFDDQDDVQDRTEVVDISGRVLNQGEAGLLGLAFHPDWQNNNEIYLSYTADANGQLESRISRFQFANDVIDPNSEEIILRFFQPFGNHNGGQILFGPDGFLYFGSGDGGDGGDPDEHAQNTNDLLGAFLRIDVDNTGNGTAYAIPSDNPFADGNGGRPEIFAWGVRNPWRWSFDKETGELWAGDVGQGRLEEVDIIELGGNYGWDRKEGFDCYEAQPPCDQLPYEDPIVQYAHNLGQSITGGYVYRGTEIPSLIGRYLFADYVSGRIWQVAYDDRTGEPFPQELTQANFRISSFAEAADGRLYVLDWSNGGVFKIEGPNDMPSTFPQLLSQTGCVDPQDPTQPSSGLVAYGLNAPFWSDGASKRRYIAIPDGETIDVNADGGFVFPIGSVIVKDFSVNGQLVETRLLMRHADGDWAGYSYEWNAAGTDAVLLPSSKRRTIPGGGEWLHPNRAECLQCHTGAAGRTLGPEISQLNGDFVYEATNRRSNQIATLQNIGMFTEDPGAVDALDALADPAGDGDLDARARAYLHTNCAQCHREGNDLRVDFDFRYTAAVDAFCNVAVINDLGLTDPAVIKPGDAANSAAVVRSNTRDVNGMPQIGSLFVDDDGVQLLTDWVNGLTCP